MRRLIGALLTAALVLVPLGAYAQKTKAQLNTEVSTNFPDNTAGSITPAILRTTTNDIIASMQQYASVNAQVGTSYAIVVGDYGKLVTLNNGSPVALALPQATGSFGTFNVFVSNLGAGLVTITPTTSTINGASTLTLPQNAAVWIISDGANYQIFRSTGGGGTCTNQVVTAISAADVPTCSSITNAFLTAGTFSNITGVGALGAGSATTGFTINASNVTWSGTIPGTNMAATNLAAGNVNGGVTGTLPFGNGGLGVTASAAFSLLGNTANNTTGLAFFTPGSLTNKTSPTGSDILLLQDQAASGALKYCTLTQCIGAVTSGVSSIDSTTGAFTTGVGIKSTGSVIQLTLANATLSGAPGSVNTAAGTATMLGTGGTCKITPTYSSRASIIYTGSFQNITPSQSITGRLLYGTGTAPTNGAATTGTQIGGSSVTTNLGAGAQMSFTLQGIVTGLTPSTAYWIDISGSAPTSTTTWLGLSCTVMEF